LTNTKIMASYDFSTEKKRPALLKLNTNFCEYQERVRELEHYEEDFYAGGIFADRDLVNASGEVSFLTVRDNQDGSGKIWTKFPGGGYKYVHNEKIYFEDLANQLHVAHFSKRMVDLIIEREKKLKRNVVEKTLVYEFIEETAYYPTSFTYCCDGKRYNTNITSQSYDYPMFFFEVKAVLSFTAKSLEEVIRRIVNVTSFNPGDPDIVKMREKVPVLSIVDNLGSLPHKKAAQIFLENYSLFCRNKASKEENFTKRISYENNGRTLGRATGMPIDNIRVPIPLVG